MNIDSFEDLIGAYALDACDDDETAAIDAYVAAHPDAAARVEQLRAAAAWLGASGSLVPPPSLRASLLRSAGMVVPATGSEAYTDVTRQLAADLESIPPDRLETATHNGLSVRELVAHLAAIDKTFLDALTATDGPRFIGADDVERITAEALAARTDTSFATIVDEWRATSGALHDAASTAPDRHVMGYRAGDALVIRAFETWTHLDDIRRAAGRPGYVPAASVLRSMADFSMRVIPYALAATGRVRSGESLRVVLTGPGGRSWNVAGAPGEEPDPEPATVMTADIVDWCHRFSDRLEPEAFTVHVDGDPELVADVVAAAPAFAGL